MKVNIDMENLSTIIEEITQANVQKAVDDAVQTVINSYIEKNYKSMINVLVFALSGCKTDIDMENYYGNGQKIPENEIDDY